MKIGRFIYKGKEIEGIVKGKTVITDCGKVCLEETKFLPPCRPSKIVCIGLNYIDHARELGMDIPDEPIIFLKPPSSVIAHNEAIIYPKQSRRIDYEAELAVVIGERCKDVSKKEALNVVLGYTILNDVTARDLQMKDGQWTRAKSFDTFAPVGPWIVTKDEVLNPNALEIKLWVNGELRQSSNTKNFIFKVEELIEFISSIMTLEKGDIISTGTPAGVGELNRGDVVEIEIERIGRLKNWVR
ncbi:MAG: 2-hydroxyhepta-2,4-diene-1,7-dioate isomerase [Thermoplasmata archaeon]|nr:MAG: 2-hydroxyhepta-2,4-diene-1,7-dioate isomerase [Thermoplasmata archaeon]